MTRPRKKWPGELDRPIKRLRSEGLTHGGRITSETVGAYNAKAVESVDKAIYAERIRRLALLAEHYDVGRQNYRGIVEGLAAEMIKHFDGDIASLRIAYKASDNKELALFLAIEFVPGFKYEPLVIKPGKISSFSDVGTRVEGQIVSGPIRGHLAEGRPAVWTRDRLLDLVDAVSSIKKSGTDREALEKLGRQPAWRGYRRVASHDPKRLRREDRH